jgi:CRP/FNR family transcriptional regulator
MPNIVGEDALAYLPKAPMLEFPKNAFIYSPKCPSDHLYLVLSGRVRIDRVSEAGCLTFLHIVRPEDFFGYSCFLPAEMALSQTAMAAEKASVMSWTPGQVDRLLNDRPQLALALARHVHSGISVLSERISGIIKLPTGPRIRIALMQLAQRTGTRQPDGAIRITGFTHQALSEYIGTSREIVSTEMNRLRRLGLLTYSRLYIDIYLEALADSIRSFGSPIRPGHTVHAFAALSSKSSGSAPDVAFQKIRQVDSVRLRA